MKQRLNFLPYSLHYSLLSVYRIGLLFFCAIVSSIVYSEPVKRIIALSPHSVELLYAIGAGDRIVGTVEYANYPESAKEILRIGNYNGIQIEQVIALKPDLIVAWKSGNKAADLEKLESLNIPIFYTSPKDIPEISVDLRKLGEKTGLQANAEVVIKQLTAKYQSIVKNYQNKRPVKVFYQLWHDPFRTVGKGSWIESLIKDCNGENLFNDTSTPYPVVSLESVLVKNPEVIIIPHHSGEIGAKKGIWKDWKEIDAVANQRLFTINGDLLHRYTPRSVDGLAKLCEAIDSAR